MKARRRCPFSNDRLRELYWRQQQNPEEIAQFVVNLGETKPARQTILRWLDEAKITRRTRAEALRLAAKKPDRKLQLQELSKRAAKVHQRMMLTGMSPTRNASQMHTAAIKKKARKAREIYSLPLEKRDCLICGGIIEKKPHRFTSDYTTCSVKCKVALLAKLKQVESPPVKCKCPVCPKEFTVTASRLKHNNGKSPCCSRACANKHRKVR